MNMLTEFKALFRLGLPVLVTQLGVIFVAFADTMMIGAYGTDELAAAAFVNSLFVIPVVMMISFAGGVTPLIGALYTKKANFEAGETLRASVQINLLCALAFTAIMGTLYFFLDAFKQPEELMPLIREYYLIILVTLVPMAFFNCFQQMANGTTDTVTPMIVIIAANCLNIVGNWFFIAGHCGAPELGIAGAGLSTLLARVFGAVCIYLIFRLQGRYRRYHEGTRSTRPLGHLRKKVWFTSYPVMIQGGIECLLWTFGTVVCGWYGKIQLAAYQVVNTLGQLGFMTFISFATATSIRVANKMGTNDLRGIRLSARCGLILNMLLATAASVLFLTLGKPILHLFTPDELVIEAAYMLVFPLVLYQYGDAIQYTYANAQRGTAVVKPLAVVSIISFLVVGFPALYLLGVTADMQSVGVFYSFSIALFTASILLFTWFYRTMRQLERKERGLCKQFA